MPVIKSTKKNVLPATMRLLLAVFFVCIAAVIGLWLWLQIVQGWSVFVVQSDSMKPAMDRGSLVITIPQATYRLDDIITYKPHPDSSLAVTHQIVKIKKQDDIAYFLTKGIANQEADSQYISQAQVIGRLFLVIPYLGFISLLLDTKLGVWVLIILPSLITILFSTIDLVSQQRKHLHATNG